MNPPSHLAHGIVIVIVVLLVSSSELEVGTVSVEEVEVTEI